LLPAVIGRVFEVVNASVTATPAVVSTRLSAAMVMDTAVGAARAMMPLGAPADAVVSVSVCTVMPVVEPAVATPMVRPARVMMKGVLVAEMPAPAVDITNEFVPGFDDVAVMAATDVLPARLFEGAAVVAKNPEG
jgi:hypothetical protein